MRRVFVDTSYLIAVLAEPDHLHRDAVRVGAQLDFDGAHFVTTRFVIAELLASVSRRGPRVRLRAAAYIQFLSSNPTWTTLDVNQTEFDAAVVLCKARLDQRYSLADCIAMGICKRLGITDVLTSDSDFTHEGFTTLLGT